MGSSAKGSNICPAFAKLDYATMRLEGALQPTIKHAHLAVHFDYGHRMLGLFYQDRVFVRVSDRIREGTFSTRRRVFQIGHIGKAKV